MAPIAAALLALGMLAAPALAGSRELTGARISLHDGDQTYPAGTPFYIYHGIGFFPGAEAPALGLADFTLEIDGVAQPRSYKTITAYPGGFVNVAFAVNFPNGMTGTHTFTGRFTIACGLYGNSLDCDGGPPSTPAELLTREITVTFTTD